MDVDHISYQQELQQSINDDVKKQDDVLQLEQSPSSPTEGNEKISTKENLRNDPSLLTKTQRRQRLFNFIIMALIAFLTGVDYAIILPTAWGYLSTLMVQHFAGTAIGILLAINSLAGAIAGLVFGYLSDCNWSLKGLVLVALLFKVVGNIIYFIGINVYVVVVSRLIDGVGMGIVPPLLAEVSRRSTPETRTGLLARILGCRQIGIFLGPALTIALKRIHFDLLGKLVTVYNSPGLVMAVLWVILTVLTLLFFTNAQVDPNDPKSLVNTLRKYSLRQVAAIIFQQCKTPSIIVLLITSFIAYFNQTVLETTLTPFTSFQFFWGTTQVSIVFAVAGAEITLVYVALQFLSKKMSDESILLSGYIILTIACLIGTITLPFSIPGDTTLLPAFLVFVGLDVLALPLIVTTCTSLFSRQSSDDYQGIIQAVQRFVVSIATVVGPLYAGGLLQHTWIMICTMFVIVLVATILILISYRSFQSKPTDESSALLANANNSTR